MTKQHENFGNNAGQVIFKGIFIYFIIAFTLCFSSILFITFYSYSTIYNQALTESSTSINNALRTERQRYSSIISSYANWNLSFQNIVTNFSPNWVQDNIVDDLKRNFGINTIGIYVDNGELSVLRASESSFGTDGKTAPEEIQAIISEFRRDIANQKSQSLMAKVGDKIHLVAISRVNGQSLNATATKSGAYLIIAKRLNENYLNELSTSYNIANISLLPVDYDSKFSSLPKITLEQNNTKLGYLAWSPRDSARQILVILIPMGFALIVILCIIGILISRRIMKAASGYETMIGDLTLSMANVGLQKAKTETTAKSKQQLLMMLGNEVKMPVDGLMGVINLLKKTDLNETQTSYVNTMESSSESLLKFVDSILEFSKVGDGEISVSYSQVNLRSIIEDVFSLMRPVAIQKNIKFTEFYSDDVPLIVRTDGLRLRQIIMHLVSNALKFTKIGSVKVNVTAIDLPNNRSEIEIQVVDTGIGIPESLKSTLFDDFFQVDQENSNSKPKSGLGLSMVKSLINAMQGKLGVESKVSHGSIFWIRIEVDVVKKINKDNSPKQSKASIERLHNVLVLDPPHEQQGMIQNLLEKSGSKVISTATETEASSLMKTQKYDALFVNTVGLSQDNQLDIQTLLTNKGDTLIVGIIESDDEEAKSKWNFDHLINTPVTSKKLEIFLGQFH